MDPESPQHREQLIERIRAYLERTGSPRLQMTLVLVVTGLAGFLASASLLSLGVTSMALRYPLAVGIAYLVFLLQMWLWLRLQPAFDPTAAGLAGMMGAAALPPGPTPEQQVAAEARKRALAEAGEQVSEKSSSSSRCEFTDIDLNLGGGDGDAAGLVVLVLILIALAAGLGASIWVIWIAPALFAELLVDGLILASLAPRLGKAASQPHWLESVLRRTWLVAFGLVVVFWLIGFGLQQTVPDARSMGQAWEITHPR